MSAVASIIFNQIRRIDEKVLTQSEDCSDGNDNEERYVESKDHNYEEEIVFEKGN